MTIQIVQWNSVEDLPSNTVVTFQPHKANDLDDVSFAKIRQSNTFTVHDGLWFRVPRLFPPYFPADGIIDSVRLRALLRYGGEGPAPGIISQYHFIGWRDDPIDPWISLDQGEESLPTGSPIKAPAEKFFNITTGDVNAVEMVVSYTLNWSGSGAPNPDIP